MEIKELPADAVVKAWHWVSTSRTLNYSDGRKVRTGETLEMKGETGNYITEVIGQSGKKLELMEPRYHDDNKPILCTQGMHGSVLLIDALKHAPGPTLCRVEISGEIQSGPDKLCGLRRKVLFIVPASKILPILKIWVVNELIKGALERRSNNVNRLRVLRRMRLGKELSLKDRENLWDWFDDSERRLVKDYSRNEITMYSIKSVVACAPLQSGPVWKAANDRLLKMIKKETGRDCSNG